MKLLILSCLTIILFTTSCKGQLSFDELTNDIPTELDVKKYTSKKMNYKLSLMNQLVLAETQYSDTSAYEMFIDTTFEFENGTSIMSILKYNSKEQTLDDAWKKLMEGRSLIENFRIYSEGKTNFLNEPSYFEHSACTISGKNNESISFLFRNNSTSFYIVTLIVNTEENYPDNMKELLYCAKSMKILP